MLITGSTKSFRVCERLTMCSIRSVGLQVSREPRAPDYGVTMGRSLLPYDPSPTCMMNTPHKTKVTIAK